MNKILIRIGEPFKAVSDISISAQYALIAEKKLPPPIYVSERIVGWRPATLDAFFAAKELLQPLCNSECDLDYLKSKMDIFIVDNPGKPIYLYKNQLDQFPDHTYKNVPLELCSIPEVK